MTDQLRQAAQAVVDRWDSLLWGGSAANLKHTGEYIAALRAALEQPAEPSALPAGWRIQRNADGSIGLFAPPPAEGESRRTSECFTGKRGNDMNEIVFKLLSHMLAAAPQSAGEPVARLLTFIGRGTYPQKGYTVARTYEELKENTYPEDWREGSKLYTAPPDTDALLRQMVLAVVELKAAESEYHDAQGGPLVRKNVPRHIQSRTILAWQVVNETLAAANKHLGEQK